MPVDIIGRYFSNLLRSTENRGKINSLAERCKTGIRIERLIHAKTIAYAKLIIAAFVAKTRCRGRVSCFNRLSEID